MITIDGSEGEGGGQILRTALSLSLITQKPFKLSNIRARRDPPGLRPQHLAAVIAAKEIGDARVSGAAVGSQSLKFEPRTIAKAERYDWNIGTAGNVNLVAQTVLLPLLTAEHPTSFSIKGGTHTSKAPSFEFVKEVYLPLLHRTGGTVHCEIHRYGFYPAGGGEVSFQVGPGAPRTPIILNETPSFSLRATAAVARLQRSVAERELKVIKDALALQDNQLHAVEVEQSGGTGNFLNIRCTSSQHVEMINVVGERGLRAELVAENAAIEVKQFLASKAPVGQHLADQLTLILAVRGGGEFRTMELTEHSHTNIEVIKRFLEITISVDDDPDSPDGKGKRVKVQS